MDLEEAQRLADAATPGPWYYEFDQDGVKGYDIYFESFDHGGYIAVQDDRLHGGGSIEKRADAEFVAAARSLLPALIAELRSARARVVELEGRP